MKHNRDWRRAALGCSFATLSFLAFASCEKAATAVDPARNAPQKDEVTTDVLARVGDVTIKRADLDARIMRLEGAARDRLADPQARRDLLAAMVQAELLALGALRRGYDKAPDAQRAIKQALVTEIVRRDIDESAAAPPVTEAEIADYYAGHPDEFRLPDRVISLPDARAAIRDKIERGRRGQRRQDLVTELRREIPVELHEDRVGGTPTPRPEAHSGSRQDATP